MVLRCEQRPGSAPDLCTHASCEDVQCQEVLMNCTACWPACAQSSTVRAILAARAAEAQDAVKICCSI